jgi:hypothetical protein
VEILNLTLRGLIQFGDYKQKAEVGLLTRIYEKGFKGYDSEGKNLWKDDKP